MHHFFLFQIQIRQVPRQLFKIFRKLQPIESQTTVAPVETESVQDQLDDIQERLDIINQQVQELIAEQNPSISPSDVDKDKTPENKNDQNKDDDQDNNKDNNNNNKNDTNNKKGGGAISYPKILISEVQINPIAQRFIELYNPNSTDVSLSGWYLQRKDSNDTSWNSLVSSTNFQNKIITANGYFLISKELENSDILSDITISNDNSLALKDPNGNISDKLGFGNAMDPELVATINPVLGQSIGRKVLSDNTEQDTDNNLNDFVNDNPTPKAQNSSESALTSIAITTPANKLIYNVGDSLDITGLVVTGTYSDGSTNVETITSTNITGFDSTNLTESETLTISFGGQIATYMVAVNQSADTTLPSITTYTISNPIISPDGDGVNDTTSIDLAFSEDVKTNVDIINSSGTKIRDLYSSSKVKNPDAKIWDGKDNSGIVVANGIYTIKITITDLAGNSIIDTSKTITVEATNWAQGIIDSFTPSGKFFIHTSDFMPNVQNSQGACRFDIKNFRDVYPNEDAELGVGSGPCSGISPSFPIDFSSYTTPGEYDIYLSYCGGDNCPDK